MKLPDAADMPTRVPREPNGLTTPDLPTAAMANTAVHPQQGGDAVQWRCGRVIRVINAWVTRCSELATLSRLACFISELPPPVGERLHCDWARATILISSRRHIFAGTVM